MSENKRRVPKLRFPGFTDDWEQRKLGEVADFYRGLTYSPEDVSNSGVRVLRSSNINEDIFEIHDDDVFVEERAVTIDLCHDDDILITSANGSSRLVGKHAIIQDLSGKTVHGGFMLLARARKYPDFINALLSAPWYNRFICQYVTGGNGAIGNLNKIDLEGQQVYIPSDNEQAEIDLFFHSFNYLTTLHQRKLSHLKRLKAGLLQKMFPRNGETVPEIRFPGFTDAWEQRKVGDFYDFKNGLNKGKEFFGSGIPIVNFTDVFNHRGLHMSELKGKVNLQAKEIINFNVQQGDIFFTRTSETIEEIGFPSVMLDKVVSTVFSGFVLRGRAKKQDPLSLLFKQYIFFTDGFRKEMQRKSSMTTRALTSGTAIRQMEFIYPVDIQEQDKIGLLFDSLDILITLHQRKLENLQKQKKALLQQMFI